VRRAIRTKIRVVSDDEHETGARAHLNLGHTIGHAIEAESGYAMRHGDCVALGLVAAMRVGVALGDATPSDLQRMTALLTRAGLPTALDRHLGPGVLGRLGADKKRAGDRVRFVVPGAPGRVRLESMEFQRIRALVSDNLASTPD
jgi:3-dehydroquinate synthetase